MCSATILHLLGRDASNVATGEVIAYSKKVNSDGHSYHVATVRVLERLKGISWNAGDIREVRVWDETDRQYSTGQPKPVNAVAALRPRSRFIFAFGEWLPTYEPGIELDGGCPIVPLNEVNLALVRRGIDLDYSAMDTAE
jgi:hypothetical protein